MLPFSEAVSVPNVNVLAPLSQTPCYQSVHAHGQRARLFQRGSPPDFSVSGNAITWLSTEYSVSPGDDVVAIYYYVA